MPVRYVPSAELHISEIELPLSVVQQTFDE